MRKKKKKKLPAAINQAAAMVIERWNAAVSTSFFLSQQLFPVNLAVQQLASAIVEYNAGLGAGSTE